MHTEGMDPYGQSLRDFQSGDTSVKFIVRRDDGYSGEMPTSVFFRKPMDFSLLEQKAMDICRGYVLDIGAGAGCHSLALQDRGILVLAIDISPHAIEVMAKRGVREVKQADVFEFRERRFDTLLMMMHGIGIVGNLLGLDRFLAHAHKLLMPNGQIVFDSFDVRRTDDSTNLAYQKANRQAGNYFGEVRTRIEYKGQIGPFFNWLNIDPETLNDHANRFGWSCRIIYCEDNGDYLAKLTPMDSP